MNGYKLLNGDCLLEMAKLADGSIAGIVTDPPYSSGSRQSIGARSSISKSKRPDEEWFACDAMGADSYAWWMREIALQGLRLVADGGTAAVFTDWRQYTTLVSAWESVGWTLKAVVVWDKNRAGAMGTFWRNNHEWVCIFAKGRANWPKGTSQFNTWQGSKPRHSPHPTSKPVELCEMLCKGVMPRAGTILDPFTGSGSVGVAAIRQGFDFVGIERDASFVGLARGRIEAERALQSLEVMPL